MKFHGNKQKQPPNPRRRPERDNPAVFSYYARGASPSSQNTGRDKSSGLGNIRRYKLRVGHIPSYLALGTILLALSYSCTLAPKPRIILLQATDTVHRDPKAYQEGIEDIWKKSPFNRTKLTVSTASLKDDITSQFSELADVEIELPLLGRRPTVILAPTKPALQLVSSNGSFYLDSNGKVMARTSDLIQNEIKNIAVVHDETGVPAELGKIAIPTLQTAFLKKLHLQLQAEGISVASIKLPARAANEAEVRINDQKPYIKFSLESDPRQAVGTYKAAKAKLDSDGVKPAEYYDVRVPEKVFYK